jgi:hypothetical protein
MIPTRLSLSRVSLIGVAYEDFTDISKARYLACVSRVLLDD